MTWILETYGPAGVQKIYGWGEGGVAAFATALGTDESALAASLAAWAGAKAVAQRSELDFLDAEDDARAKQTASDWVGMAAALKKALVAKPGDPQTLFNLASAQMRAGDYAGAEATLKKLLGQTLPPTASRFVVFGHYQLGRVYDLAGRRADALAEYDAVLALPDDHGAHDLARERKLSPATKAQLE
jgi:tetratricopeptide (TPR) repeat protein